MYSTSTSQTLTYPSSATATASIPATPSNSSSPEPSSPTFTPSSTPMSTLLTFPSDTSEPPGMSTTADPSSSSSRHTSTAGSHTSGKNDTGAIVGGVIAGLILLLTIYAAILLRRRKRARRTAPSAEFMDIVRHGRLGFGAGGSGALSPVKRDDGALTPSSDYYSVAVGSTGGLDLASEHPLHPLARQSTLESDELPPAFTPGSYKDPVLENVHAAAEMREYYLRRESLVSMAGAGPLGLDGHESQGDHGHEHTMELEKATYAWAI
ncbi:hypothetical protein C8Q70DRAFT_1049133 [Cubamyces menziesii]|nr:hypothetical protein C8Q70DRAFT_1049133 [Cubamyces menziesii]